jgi:hypothetical protein
MSGNVYNKVAHRFVCFTCNGKKLNIIVRILIATVYPY